MTAQEGFCYCSWLGLGIRVDIRLSCLLFMQYEICTQQQFVR